MRGAAGLCTARSGDHGPAAPAAAAESRLRAADAAAAAGSRLETGTIAATNANAETNARAAAIAAAGTAEGTMEGTGGLAKLFRLGGDVQVPSVHIVIIAICA